MRPFTEPRRAALAAAALLLSLLACNAPLSGAGEPTAAPASLPAVPAAQDPTAFAQAVCTPPACAPGEVYACPSGDCPGGCGTVCATAAAPATDEPTPGLPFVPPDSPPANARFEGVSFHFDLDLVSQWQAAIVPADDPASGAPEAWLIPSHYLFTFPDYPVTGSIQTPRIMIFPMDNWEGYNETGLERIGELRTLLQEQPGLAEREDEIPVVPIFNAAQVFHTNTAYLSFQNGTGVRFVTYYAQDVSPIVNAGAFYTFQGLTLDGAYLVAAFLPIRHPGLAEDYNDIPGGDYDAFANNYLNYVAGIEEMLNRSAPADFTPDLALLDALIQSLRVE